MSPTTSRDFLKAAFQRRSTAEFLFELKYNLDAQYLDGYAVECALKALILDRTIDSHKPAMLKRITSGAPMHRPEVLLGELRQLGINLPIEIAKRLRRFDWTTSLRYESGRKKYRRDNWIVEDRSGDL